MTNPLKKILRRKKIRKFASDVPTGFITVSSASSANIVLDAEDLEIEGLMEDILAWSGRKGLKTGVYFLDFRKNSEDNAVRPGRGTTIQRQDLDWTGAPETGLVTKLLKEESDIFISLVRNGDFTIDFLSKCTRARFKAGCCGYEGHVFDMTVTGKTQEQSSRQAFAAITDLMDKIVQ